jgi:phytoene synthase
MILKIFGYKDYEAENYAASLGIAMQLTNILRDIKEDYRRGRIYLPQDEMLHFGVTENDIAEENCDDRFKSLLRFQIKRARQFYRNSEPGLAMITDPRCRFVARVMKEVYSGILEEIEKNNYDVFSKRAYVGLPGQLIRTWRTLKGSK